MPHALLPRTSLAKTLAGSLLALATATSFAQENNCGPIANAFGPFDYRMAKDKLPIVEPHHFSPQVEALIRGQSGYLGGDIDYTLRAFPNHHRALLAMMRYGERTHQAKVPDAQYTVECYFDRALRFKPDDNVARMLYVTFLNKQNRSAEARQQMAEVVRRAGDDPFANYNAGLVYLEMKEYGPARQQAWRAAALGFPRSELRDGLKAVGQWSEPPAGAASGAASGADASAAPSATAASAP